MKSLPLLTVVLFAIVAPFVHADAVDPATGDVKPQMTAEPLVGYKLVFSDEFNAPSVDEGKWLYRTGGRLLSVQQKENVAVNDGHLRVALKKEKSGKYDFTAGGIISKESFTYGYFEAKFRCPKTAGWHTAFWTMKYGADPIASGAPGAKPTDTHNARRQEIDICEQDSVNTRSYSAGVIDWSGKQTKNFGRIYYRDPSPDFSADFHVFGCEFTPTKVKFFLDGKLTHQTDAAAFPHGPQQVWLTCVAALWGNPKKPDRVDESSLPQYAEFDWVRVYARQP